MQIDGATISYMHLLAGVSQLVDRVGFGARAMLYCCAAVSDFFVPAREMVQHKIQR